MSIFPAVRPAVSPAVRGAFEQGSGGGAASIIAGLFAQGQQGFWLPFTDFASLSQDSAGTLPYTALEQPVGLIYDKSRGGALSAEMLTNGNFATDSGWVKGVGWTIVGGKAYADGTNVSTSYLGSPVTTEVGKVYEVAFDYIVTAGRLRTNGAVTSTLLNAGSSGRYQGRHPSPLTGTYNLALQAVDAGTIATVWNVTFKEVLGNHASQATSTARGVVSARVNALLNTDNPAAWGYAGSRFSVGAKDVDGGWPLTHILGSSIAVNTDYPIGASGVSDVTIVRSIELQAGTASFVTYGAASGTDAVQIDLVSKTIITNSGGLPVTLTSLPDNWVRVEFWVSRAGNFSASSLSNYMAWGIAANTVTVGSTIKVRKPSYSRHALGYTAPVPFQRVGASASDYDSAGFPKYLRLDGTDDSYTCGGGGSTTGFYYSDVIRPTSSAVTVLFSDIGTNSGYELAIMNTGALKLFFGNGTSFSSVSIGGVLISALTHVAVWDDASNIYLQTNGGTPVTVARGVFVAGTANCTLYRTNSVSAFFFNGQITEPIYRAGPPPSAYEREVIRNYQMQKAGLL